LNSGKYFSLYVNAASLNRHLKVVLFEWNCKANFQKVLEPIRLNEIDVHLNNNCIKNSIFKFFSWD